MNEKEIKKRIEEVEAQINSVDLSMTTVEYLDKLLDIHTKLWNLEYFKKHQEKNF